eukprot:1633328-Amphidinium_carterae.1
MEAKPGAAGNWVPPNCSSEAKEVSSSSELGKSSCKQSVDKLKQQTGFIVHTQNSNLCVTEGRVLGACSRRLHI